MTAALVLFALAGAALDISGGGDCPKPAEVSARLSEILVVPTGHALDARAHVAREGNRLDIVLSLRNGQLIGTRTLTAQGSCEDLAAAAAVVLATWLGDTYPEILGTAPPDQPVPRPVPAAKAPVEPAAAEARGARPRPSAQREPAARTPLKLGSSAALGASITGAGAAPIASFGVSLMRTAPSFGWWLGATIAGSQEVPLGEGVLRFSRWPAMTGPTFRMASDSLRADLTAGAAVGLLALEGDGFAEDNEARDLTYGPFAAVRVSGRSQTLEPFLGVTALFWAKRATAYIESPARTELELPRVELWLLAGVAVER